MVQGGAQPGGQDSIRYWLGVDVGGTFTDVVLAGPEGQVAVAKTLSTHHDPAEGICRGIEIALAEGGIEASDVGRVVHATTLATNAILERQGARVAFITTQGFGRLLTLGRYARVEEDRYDIHFAQPEAPVPPEHCFEVTERLDSRGEVIIPLDEASVREVAGCIAKLDIEAVAVSLLHSYANAAHEARVLEILREELPESVTLVASSQIWPEIREYERTTTTIMSAYIGPVMITYLRALEARLRDIGIDVGVQVMESGGGVMSADLAGRRAVATIESGPAAGVISARATALAAGRKDVVSFDMGGTTAKACVVLDGEPEITHEFHVGGKGSFGGRRAGTGIPIKTPAIDLAEVGAGGGSIAWVDDIGALHVGPRSAGSQPGPACYGNGGEQPTVTDCNLVLGYLDPSSIAGGTLTLHADLAHDVVRTALAEKLSTTPARAASAVHAIANATMAAAVHVVTVQRGIDPRGFAMVAFGGAGPMHAARVAEDFDIDTVLVPPSCGVGSAVGLLVTDLSTDRVATHIIPLEEATTELLDDLFAPLAEAAATDLDVKVSDADVEVHRSIDVRLRGQAHQLTIQAGDTALDDAERSRIADRFFQEYERAYGIATRGPVELVTYRVRVTKVVPKAPIGLRSPSTVSSEPKAHRDVWFDEAGDYRSTPVYDRALLGQGTQLAGPAIVQDTESTIVVPPGWDAGIDTELNVVLTRNRDAVTTSATEQEAVA